MNFDKMNGYQFEEFTGKLFKAMGFNVLNTSLSGDGGIDVVAVYPDDIFKGKYIIQCKNWKGNVGEPPVRDLYGVILSENANKGILITTSDFTKGALQFAHGKNIELINGDALNRIIRRYIDLNNSNDEVGSDADEIYFLASPKFNKSKFEHLNELISEDKKNMQLHIDMLNFLISYFND